MQDLRNNHNLSNRPCVFVTKAVWRTVMVPQQVEQIYLTSLTWGVSKSKCERGD